MSSLPSSAIVLADGEATIDAELLASKLGLSTEALKTEVRKGLVYAVAEKGLDEDEGRTRLTFRYRARSWTVVVEPDSTLVESPSQANKGGPSLIDHVRKAS